MKTKKTAKIISSVLALVMLVCSLSAVSGFVTTAETGSGESAVNALKTAWQAMYKKSNIAVFSIDSPYMKNQLNTDNIISSDSDVWAKSFAFNTENGTFDKSQTQQTVYTRGLFFKFENGKLFDNGVSAFNNAFNNNDSLYFNFNPGTVKTSGNLLVILQYNGWGSKYVLYAEVPVIAGDNKIQLENLTYKCADSTYTEEIPTFNKLSDILNTFRGKELNSLRIMFDKDVNIEGATISSLQGEKFVSLPDGNDSFTVADWYNSAKDLDVSGYENADTFTSALNNLKTYLSENDPNFIVSDLKVSWGKLSKVESIANFDSNSKIVNQRNMNNNFNPVSSMGITFDGENGTFDKAAYDVDGSPVFGGNYRLYGIAFNNGDKLFGNNTDFTNAFNNDSLYFTFNPGTVTANGSLSVYLQYNGDGSTNVLYSTVNIVKSDSNAEKNIVIKDLEFKCGSSADTNTYKFDKLSDALTYTNSAGDVKDLITVKIFFNPGLVATGASISGLKTVKTETVPTDTDNELISGKSLRVNAGYYGDIANDFIANRVKFYNILMTGKTLGDVNGLGDTNNICDLVALNDLMPVGYNTDNTYSITGDMNTDGYITAEDTALLRAELLK